MKKDVIDNVNINLVHINGIKPLDAFADHSGSRLVIESENPLVVNFSILLLFLMLTGSHNLLNYAIICLSNKQTTI